MNSSMMKTANNDAPTVLMTGATGFIGSHTVLELLNAGCRVVAIGNSATGYGDGVCVLPQCLMNVLVLAKCHGSMLKFRRCNLQNLADVEKIFKEEKFDAVIHLASSKGVAPSIAAPLEYYANNLVSSINLLKLCGKYGHKKFIFMSSATVYGVPKEMPVKETTKIGQEITNPYGCAKYMIEQILQDICRSSKAWKIIILRAFDPAGAHPSGLLGEDINSAGPKHLMPLIASVTLGKMEALRVCGNKFPTKDGSGSRDFVHVVDIARAIVLSLQRILPLGGNGIEGEKKEREMMAEDANIEVFNLGLGIDHTVLEMVANYERACGKKINTIISPPRPGDVASIYCDISAAKRDLKWSPKFGVEEICEHLHKWYSRFPNGYK